MPRGRSAAKFPSMEGLVRSQPYGRPFQVVWQCCPKVVGRANSISAVDVGPALSNGRPDTRRHGIAIARAPWRAFRWGMNLSRDVVQLEFHLTPAAEDVQGDYSGLGLGIATALLGRHGRSRRCPFGRLERDYRPSGIRAPSRHSALRCRPWWRRPRGSYRRCGRISHEPRSRLSARRGWLRMRRGHELLRLPP